MIEDGADYFCVGIDHALALSAEGRSRSAGRRGRFSMRGHSVGGFGSVTTNKVIATIAGQVFGKDVQAYPKYGSEKKGSADYLLSHDCRFAHLFAQRTTVRRPGRVERHQRALQRQSAQGNGALAAHIFMQSTYRESR